MSVLPGFARRDNRGGCHHVSNHDSKSVTWRVGRAFAAASTGCTGCRIVARVYWEASMHSCLVNPPTPFPSVRIALLAILTLLTSGWTCNAFFVSCQNAVAQPQIASLSPGAIRFDAESVVLTVEGSGFTAQSHILWNGNALQTTFTDSRHVEATITPQIFDSFGGSAGSGAQISVRTEGSDRGCPPSKDSDSLLLDIH